MQTHVGQGEAVADENTVFARRDTRCILDADEFFLKTAGKRGRKKDNVAQNVLWLLPPYIESVADFEQYFISPIYCNPDVDTQRNMCQLTRKMNTTVPTTSRN